MSRRRLFVPPDRMRATPITVTGDEHHHLARVLRARPGDAITLFDGAGGELEARVVRVGRAETELAAGAGAGRRRARDAPRAGAPLVLLTAVPRGGRMDFLVQKCSELGVSRIVPDHRGAFGRASRAGAARALGEDRARSGPAVRAGGRSGGGGAATLAAALAAPELPERRLVLSPDAGRPVAARAAARSGRDRAAGRPGRRARRRRERGRARRPVSCR